VAASAEGPVEAGRLAPPRIGQRGLHQAALDGAPAERAIYAPARHGGDQPGHSQRAKVLVHLRAAYSKRYRRLKVI
jgi:hypothetical protein